MPAIKARSELSVLGLNTGAPGENLDARQATDAGNMEVNRSVIRKRQGEDALGASLGEQVMAMRELKIGDLSYFLRFGLTKTEKLNTGTGAWEDVANAPWTGTVNDRFDFAFPLIGGSKVMVITNGIDEVRKYTGTGNTAALGGTPPKAKFALEYLGFLLLLNITDDGLGNAFGARVQWSDAGDPESWTPGPGSSAGSVDLVEDGLDITGVELFGKYVAVHKENAIYLGYPVDTSQVFQFDRYATGVGAVSKETIQSLPDGSQIFLARDGLHLFNGITAPLVSSPIMDEIRESLSPQYAYRSVSGLVRELDEYWVAMPTGGDSNPETVYKYNYRLGYAWKDERVDLTAMATYSKTSATSWDDAQGTWNQAPGRWNDVTNLVLNPVVTFGHDSGVTTQRENVPSDNGVAIDAFWDTKDFTCKDGGLDEDGVLVRWLKMQVWAKGDTVTLFYSVDEGVNWVEVGQKALAGAYPADRSPLYFYFDVVATQIRFRFRNSTLDETFTLKKFVVKGLTREMRE